MGAYSLGACSLGAYNLGLPILEQRDDDEEGREIEMWVAELIMQIFNVKYESEECEELADKFFQRVPMATLLPRSMEFAMPGNRHVLEDLVRENLRDQCKQI